MPPWRIAAVPLIVVVIASCVEIPFEDPRNAGGGHGFLTVEPAHVPAAAFTTLTFTFEAGDGGVVAGGGFRLQLPVDPVHPFLGFTPPHTGRHVDPGYVACRREEDPGRENVLASIGMAGEVRCLIDSGRLEAGDRLVMTYRGLMPRVSGVWRLPVESRRSGGRGGLPIAHPPVLTVHPRPARALHAVLPSQAIPDEPLTLHIAALDEFGNLDPEYRGEIRVSWREGEERDEEERTSAFTAQDEGVLRATLVPRRAGILRAEVVERAAEYPLRARTNPVRVTDRGAPGAGRVILWGDPHAYAGAHDARHHGFGPPTARHGDRRGDMISPEGALVHAREVMRLDFAAMVLPPAASAEARERAAAHVARYDGTIISFSALHAIAWRDRLILGERPLPPVNESRRATDEAHELRRAIAGHGAVEFLTGSDRIDPAATGWEIYSWRNRGSGYVDDVERFEPRALPAGIPAAAQAWSVIAGTANPWGRPGTRDRTGLEPGAGGLTAVVARRNTPGEILSALREGRSWATTGARILLLAGDPEGRSIAYEAAGEDILESVDLILLDRAGRRAIPLIDEPAWIAQGRADLPDDARDGFWFLRAIQRDGETAWSGLHRIAD